MDYKDITHLQRQVNKLLAQQARQIPLTMAAVLEVASATYSAGVWTAVDVSSAGNAQKVATVTAYETSGGYDLPVIIDWRIDPADNDEIEVNSSVALTARLIIVVGAL
jgi:hypothetical protein